MTTKILTQADVRKAISMPKAISAVENALAEYARGSAQMPPKTYLSLAQFDGDFRAMPAFLDNAAGVKWVNSHPHNFERFGLPTVMGLYILSDPTNALPLAVMDATYLTAIRTGAAAAVASKYLAPLPSTTLGLLGCGVQAHFLLEAHNVLFPELKIIVNDLDTDTANAFARKYNAQIGSVEQVSNCDIVCTSTPSRSPLISQEMLKNKTVHINAMGADASGKQEIASEIVRDASIIVDELEQAAHSGEINVPLKNQAIAVSDIVATLGQVIVGERNPRSEYPKRTTLFDSTGLALQDVAVARAIFDAANKLSLGQTINFFN
tara:strand:- start:347 stop:1312 length:966 start_codon:yes stop_codon:yes gene_type:complete